MIGLSSSWQVKNPSASSSVVVADDQIASAVNLMRSPESNSRVNEESGRLSCNMARRECTSRVSAEIHMFSSVGQRGLWMSA